MGDLLRKSVSRPSPDIPQKRVKYILEEKVERQSSHCVTLISHSLNCLDRVDH